MIWAKITGAIAFVLVPVLVIFKKLSAKTNQRLGRKEAELEAAKHEVEQAKQRTEIDSDVSREPDPVKRLHDKWSRD